MNSTEPPSAHDLYSASKIKSNLTTQFWLASFENVTTTITTGGNLVGCGVICADIVVPDLVKSYSEGLFPKLCTSNSVRPWQNVLDFLKRLFAPINW